MHAHAIDDWRHEHVFLGAGHAKNERRSWAVIALCAATMAAEIGGGAVFHSMALVADGLHMSTHAGALLVAALAYRYARRHARDERFVFGTGKLGDLAGFASAVGLAMFALLIAVESVLRLVHPVPIAFADAIPIAALGLVVNLVSAWLLHDDEPPAVADSDHNLRAAYVHVLADAVVAVLALFGLVAGAVFGWVWMDALMGIAGAIVIANWSLGLMRLSGSVLLDMAGDRDLAGEVARRLEAGGCDRVADLHVWRVGPGHNAAVVAIVSDRPAPPDAYKARLAGLAGLSHVTVEVQTCPGAH